MLDAPGNSVSHRELAAALRRHHDGGLSRPPAELFDALADHFLRVSEVAVNWVHPSWRDLVIDDLAVDRERRRRFLSRCGLDGVLVAISTWGGTQGTRAFPLLVEDADWDSSVDRVWKLTPELEDPDLARLLWSLGEAVESAQDESQRREAEGLARTALEHSLRRFGDQPVPLDLLDPWFELASRLEDPPSLSLAATWAELLTSMPLRIESAYDLARVDEWLRVAEHLARHDPEQLVSFGFPERYMSIGEALVPAVHAASLTIAEDRALLVRVLERALHLVPDWSSALGSEWLGLREAELDEYGPEPSRGTPAVRDPGLSVARILRDL
jgi:hypothetical protein